MSSSDEIMKLLAAAQDIMVRAERDQALAERLLSVPHDVIAEETGFAFPNGIDFQAKRNETGALEMTASIGKAFEGELDDAFLERVAGGRTGIISNLHIALA